MSGRRRLALIAAVAVALGWLGPAAASSETRQAGWQWMSAYGVEVAIPRAWTIADMACSEHVMPIAGVRRACLLPRSEEARPFIEINGYLEETTSPEPIVVDGHQATLETTTYGTRTQAILRFTDTGLAVTARLADTALLDRIIRGIRLVATDHAGCPTATPPAERPKARRDGTAESLLPGTPSEIVLCHYGSKSLSASAVARGKHVEAIQTALRDAPAGPNRDRPDSCASTVERRSLVLTARYKRGPDVTVLVDYGGCVGRWVDNGARVVHVTEALLHAAVVTTGTTAGYAGDIP